MQNIRIYMNVTAGHEHLASLVLIDFSVTVKAVTLIFISGRGSAISSAKLYLKFGKELISFLSRANVRAFHENPNRIHLEGHNHNIYVFCCPLIYLKLHRQTVWTQIRLLL